MDVIQLVCLNNVNSTIIDMRSNTLTCIDLTLVSNNLANSCGILMTVQVLGATTFQ